MMKFYTRADQKYQTFRQNYPLFFALSCAALAGLLAIGFFLYLKSRYFFFYSINDDMYIRDMLDGELYSTGYTIMIKNWLGTLLAALYRWRPYTEWYALMIWSSVLASLGACFYTILTHIKRLASIGVFFFCYLIFCLCFANHFLVTTYTEVAALLMLASAVTAHGAFRFHNENGRRIPLLIALLVAVGLAVLSFSLRTDACLMIFPFAGVLFLDCLLPEHTKRPELRHTVLLSLYLAILIVFFAGIYLQDRAAYLHVEGYENVLSYCDATNPMYNFYGIPDYYSNIDFYKSIGMSETTWNFFSTHNYIFAQDFNPVQITALGQYTLQTASSPSLMQWLRNLSDSLLFTNFYPLGLMAAVTSFINLLFALLSRDKRAFLVQLGIVLAYFVDASYLAYAGRLPDRVIVPLYVALLLINLYLLVSRLSFGRKGLAVSLFFAVGFFFFQGAVVTDIQDSQGLQLTLFDRQETVYHYMAEHPDNFYLVSPYLHPSGGAFTYDKTQRSSNYVYYADYTTYLPEWQKKVEDNGYDPAHLLDEFIADEHLLIIAPSDELAPLIDEYLAEHYPDRQLIQVDTLCGYYPVYNVVKVEN